VDILESGKKCRIVITGSANKNKLGNEQKLKSIAQILSEKRLDLR
jgi:hypothetical protein